MTPEQTQERLESFRKTAPRGAKRNPVWFDVAPRYTCGSPGMVGEEIALWLARRELEGYRYAMDGGEEQARALREGLTGIAQARRETPKGWDVLDLCTGERRLRPFGT